MNHFRYSIKKVVAKNTVCENKKINKFDTSSVQVQAKMEKMIDKILLNVSGLKDMQKYLI